jgi:hypothetical protein
LVVTAASLDSAAPRRQRREPRKVGLGAVEVCSDEGAWTVLCQRAGAADERGAPGEEPESCAKFVPGGGDDAAEEVEDGQIRDRDERPAEGVRERVTEPVAPDSDREPEPAEHGERHLD